MAYTVSQNFKTAVKDETVKKSCLILFGDLFFDSTDITEGGVTVEQYFNTSDDLTFGDCPSDTLSFSVVSNGNLAGYGFGKCSAYLGVQTASSAYAFGDINAHIEVGANTYTASASGLYRNSTKIDNGVYLSLVSDGTYIYAVGANASVRVTNSNGTVASYTPNRFMAQKLQSGLSAVFASNTAYVWDGENVLTFEYVPMGVFNVVKPRSTVGDVVTIQDAYDNMALFDRDAREFINSLAFPQTLSQIYTALCNYVGVSYASSTFTYSTTNYSSSPFPDTQCTLRDILWWIAERARRVAHFNRTGVLELRSISTTVRETLTASDIGQDGYSIAEYVTPAVTGVLLRGSSGNSLTFGALDTAYVITANPFVSTISVSDLQAYMAIPTYVPMELMVLEADPSIDVGDFVSIRPMVEESKILTNVYNEAYAHAVALQTSTGNAITDPVTGDLIAQINAWAIPSPTYSIPIMNRSVHFNGGIRATYTATGNENREADLDNTEYNADVAANMAVDKSKAYADSVGTSVDDSFTQQKVFNRLTDNGRAQGIYMDANGDIYFNATYIQSGYISADRINAHTISVSKLTGNITYGEWIIDLDNGTMTLGKLAVGSITGTLSTTSTTGTSWGINFTNGTMNIGTLAVGKITGSLTTTSTSSSAWGIDFTNGTMNIGTLAVGKITGSKSLGNNWSIDFTNGTMSIGNLSADNITAGTITAAVTATNLTMTGGSIQLQTSSETTDRIWLDYGTGTDFIRSSARPGNFKVRKGDGKTSYMTQQGFTAMINDMDGSGQGTSVAGLYINPSTNGGLLRLKDSSGNYTVELSHATGGGGSLLLYYNNQCRASLNDGGLYFYDSSGSRICSYYSTGITLKDANLTDRVVIQNEIHIKDSNGTDRSVIYATGTINLSNASGTLLCSLTSTSGGNGTLNLRDGTTDKIRTILNDGGLYFYDSSGTQVLRIRPASSGNITIQPTVVSTW